MTKVVKAKPKVIRKPEIFNKLKQLAESGQTFGVPHQQLADKLNVKRQTISDYLKTIYAEVPTEDIKSVEIKIELMYERLIREAQKMLNTASDNKERDAAIRLLLLMTDKYILFLESFGRKEKVSDKIDIRSVHIEIDHKSVSSEILKELSQ